MSNLAKLGVRAFKGAKPFLHNIYISFEGDVNKPILFNLNSVKSECRGVKN